MACCTWATVSSRARHSTSDTKYSQGGKLVCRSGVAASGVSGRGSAAAPGALAWAAGRRRPCLRGSPKARLQGREGVLGTAAGAVPTRCPRKAVCARRCQHPGSAKRWWAAPRQEACRARVRRQRSQRGGPTGARCARCEPLAAAQARPPARARPAAAGCSGHTPWLPPGRYQRGPAQRASRLRHQGGAGRGRGGAGSVSHTGSTVGGRERRMAGITAGRRAVEGADAAPKRACALQRSMGTRSTSRGAPGSPISNIASQDPARKSTPWKARCACWPCCAACWPAKPRCTQAATPAANASGSAKLVALSRPAASSWARSCARAASSAESKAPRSTLRWAKGSNIGSCRHASHRMCRSLSALCRAQRAVSKQRATRPHRWHAHQWLEHPSLCSRRCSHAPSCASLSHLRTAPHRLLPASLATPAKPADSSARLPGRSEGLATPSAPCCCSCAASAALAGAASPLQGPRCCRGCIPGACGGPEGGSSEWAVPESSPTRRRLAPPSSPAATAGVLSSAAEPLPAEGPAEPARCQAGWVGTAPEAGRPCTSLPLGPGGPGEASRWLEGRAPSSVR